MICKAFRKSNNEVHVCANDFLKLFTGEGKLIKTTMKLDEQANEYRKNCKLKNGNPRILVNSSNSLKSRFQKNHEFELLRKTKQEQITKFRRNAAVYISSDEIDTSKLQKRSYYDIHKKHTNAIDQIYVNMPKIEAINDLKKEIKSIKRGLMKSQIESDIKKYAEIWRDASDIKNNDLKENMKFLKKVEASSEHLKAKYGEKAYDLIEFLIIRIMRDPMTGSDKVHNKLIERAVNFALLKNKEMKYSVNSFPHPIMVFHEKLLESWWFGAKTMTPLEVFKLLREHKFINYQTELESQAKLEGLDLSKGFISFKEFTAFFARPLLYAALSNVCHLLINKMKFQVDSLPVKMSGFKRTIYINGVKNYKKITKEESDVLKTAQKLLMKEKGFTDPAEYFFYIVLFFNREFKKLENQRLEKEKLEKEQIIYENEQFSELSCSPRTSMNNKAGGSKMAENSSQSNSEDESDEEAMREFEERLKRRSKRRLSDELIDVRRMSVMKKSPSINSKHNDASINSDENKAIPNEGPKRRNAILKIIPVEKCD